MSATVERQRAGTNDALGVLLGLARRVRHVASAEELHFVMVNETVALAPYRQAVLWRAGQGVVAVSGVATAEHNAPFTIWLDRLFRRLAPTLGGPREFTAADCQEGNQWADWLPPYLLALPLHAPDGKQLGILGFAREQPWSDAESVFINEITETYALAWSWHHRPTLLKTLRTRITRARYRGWFAAAALICLALLPVHLSVLAPGEVVARDPAAIRAPIEGVIDRVLVRPNEMVAQGQVLVELDTTTIRGKMDVARKTLTTAEAEFEQASMQAFSDPKAKAQLGVLSGRIEERRADIAYLAGLLERAQIKAPRAGVAVLDDPSEWAGRPVTIGEKILAIADDHDTELEGWLSPSDMIDLPQGTRATLFLNIDPTHPVRASLRYVAYEALPLPDGTLANRLRATIAGDKPRLGLKGTIRLDGHRVALAYWIFRRPLAVIRQKIGL